MTDQKNIASFNSCAAVVLSSLYDSFPVPTQLDSWSLQPKDAANKTLSIYSDHRNEELESNEIDENLRVYRWTIQFLIHEGFIRDLDEERLEKIQRYNGNAPIRAPAAPIFPALALTAKGLALLNAIPNSISEKNQSFIERIKAALKEHSENGVREVITAFISQAVTGIIG
ncbi:hypothetical protein E0E54_20750 [Azotobacter chroococcum]|uniref:hypothetical protein n=1 Tax=Azotobacter chroococcum TaxID=353 RepID=UPI00103DC909|nr:hypothetical protein [Azotobacter chroococcum]TBW31898.1 hypothetical protein E0E54_20750 [Azotobacter chroococcum]